jgi:hypothetical protein
MQLQQQQQQEKQQEGQLAAHKEQHQLQEQQQQQQQQQQQPEARLMGAGTPHKSHSLAQESGGIDGGSAITLQLAGSLLADAGDMLELPPAQQWLVPPFSPFKVRFFNAAKPGHFVHVASCSSLTVRVGVRYTMQFKSQRPSDLFGTFHFHALLVTCALHQPNQSAW